MKTSPWMFAVSLVSAVVLLLGACESKPKESVEDRKHVVGVEESVQTAHAAPTPSELAAAACRVSLAVDGMVCSHGCPPVIMQTLEGVAGVSHVNVDFPSKHAEVLGDGAICTEPGSQGLVDALKTKNYSGRVENIEHLGS